MGPRLRLPSRAPGTTESGNGSTSPQGESSIVNRYRLCSTLCLTSTRHGFHRSIVLVSRSQSRRFSQSSRSRRSRVRCTYGFSMRSACRILWLHQRGAVRGPVPERMDAKGIILLTVLCRFHIQSVMKIVFDAVGCRRTKNKSNT